MALIKLGAIVTQISGKAGGQQFGQNAGGHYLKNNGTPRKSITLKQQKQMAVMASSAQSWRALQHHERIPFINASPEYPYLNRVGETKYHSGFAIYTMLKNNKQNTQSELTTLPIPLPKVSFPPTEFGCSTESLTQIDVFISPAVSPYRYRIYCTRPLSVGVTNSYKNMTLLHDFSAGQASTLTNLSSYLFNAYGFARPNTKHFVRLDIVDPTTGQFLRNIGSDVFQY